MIDNAKGNAMSATFSRERQSDRPCTYDENVGFHAISSAPLVLPLVPREISSMRRPRLRKRKNLPNDSLSKLENGVKFGAHERQG